ncbi:hypothetical protein [Dyadobacter sp. CY326]|nr:hypothetical protein [Dyadobacter sp. CY326]
MKTKTTPYYLQSFFLFVILGLGVAKSNSEAFADAILEVAGWINQ